MYQQSIFQNSVFRSLPDRVISQVPEQEEESARYEIVEHGSKRGGRKLVSNRGYSYVFKV